MSTQTNVIVAVVTIAVISAAGFFGYRWYQNKDVKKVRGGRLPTPSDVDCATGGLNKRIIGICSKPIIDPRIMPSSMKQKCFTSDELGLTEGQPGPDKVTEQNGFGTTWYLNYQSGDNFCYRSPEYIK